MTTSTERLYLPDPFVLFFEASIVARARHGSSPSVVLDRTAFYPEGGGQLGDQGVLTVGQISLRVVDVQVDDDGVIHHVLDAEAGEEVLGRPVRGDVDAVRRRDHMSQHTAQHMLSSALLHVARADTVSSRLGAETSTIDVDVAALDEGLVGQAEARVNDAVLDDREIRILFPTPEELPGLALRRAPKVDVGVRVIHVAGFDVSPCGGTHCTRTGQVGPVRVVGLERYKGGTRVTFVAGKRALADYARKDAALRELARGLSCGPMDVAAAVGKLRIELRARMDLFGAARGELVSLLAARLWATNAPDPSGTTRIVALREGDDLGALRALASALTKRPDVVAVVASRESAEGDWQVVVERGAAAGFDAGAWLRQQTTALGGRGGGRPERAEGRLPSSVDPTALSR